MAVLTEWRRSVAKSSPNPRAKGGLTRWFAENWVDVKTGKPCGRTKGEKRGYPACRPSKRVSSKTPKTVGEMTASEKARFKREKTSSKKITYQHRRKKTQKELKMAKSAAMSRCLGYISSVRKGKKKKSSKKSTKSKKK